MKIRNILLAFLLIVCNNLCKSQKKIESAKIMYVNFLIMTDVNVSCSDFESSFKYKSFEINDPIKLDSIQSYISTFKIDSINNKEPDTRAKIILNYISNERDTICLSNFRICFNGIPIVNNIEFTNYVKKLIVVSQIVKKKLYSRHKSTKCLSEVSENNPMLF
jgi:hypothetical protein